MPKPNTDLVGRTITAMRAMTLAERRHEGWLHSYCSAVVIELDDGTILYPSCDPEGNGPGALFGVQLGASIYFYPPVKVKETVKAPRYKSRTT
jgi:hypothetical protein